MITKLQLEAAERSINENSIFEAGRVYPAVCQDNLLLIDCDGVVVMECVSEITNRHFEVVSSIDVELRGRLMIDELYRETSTVTADKFVPTLVSN